MRIVLQQRLRMSVHLYEDVDAYERVLGNFVGGEYVGDDGSVHDDRYGGGGVDYVNDDYAKNDVRVRERYELSHSTSSSSRMNQLHFHLILTPSHSYYRV